MKPCAKVEKSERNGKTLAVMRTALIANRKGGVGKTLIAVNLATALAARGLRVAVADADRQQSSAGWLERRPKDVPRIRGLDWSKTSAIGDYPKRLDWLIIDAPGALKGSKAESLIAEAKAVLIPVQPSIFDETSTKGFLDEIEDVKRVRKGKVGVHLIANRYRARTKAAAALDLFLQKLGHEPLTRLSERAIYSEYATEGLGIFDRELAVLRPLKLQWEPILAATVG